MNPRAVPAFACFLLACGGDPFTLADEAPATVVLLDGAVVPVAPVRGMVGPPDPVSPPATDGAAPSPRPDAGGTVDAPSPVTERNPTLDAGDVPDAAGKPDVAAPFEAASPDAGAVDAEPPPPLCCPAHGVVQTCTERPYECYPRDVSCSVTGQALPDGGQISIVSCPTAGAACGSSACTAGAYCVVTDAQGQWPGYLEPCP